MVRMLARNLDSSPAANEIGLVASTYHDDLVRMGFTDEDADRVRGSFQTLGVSISRFPTVAMILAAMPPKQKPKMLTRELTDDERKRNIDNLHRMLSEVFDK